MRALISAIAMVGASGCGLELFFENVAHVPNERPASRLVGKTKFPKAKITVTDAAGKEIVPFQTTRDGGVYELRLPSAKYSNLIMNAVAGNTTLQALVPQVAEESSLAIDVDEESTTEALIAEARLSADGKKWNQVTPETYIATRMLIRNAFGQGGPAADLLAMVNRIVTMRADPSSGSDPAFFLVPKLKSDFTTISSALDPNWVEQSRFDIDGDGNANATSEVFDSMVSNAAKLYRPAGCPDPERIRIMFTVDFNDGRKDGNCATVNRFKWATDKPGKSMFFVGWLHKDSSVQDPLVNALLGSGVPNQLAMHDDGLGGDELAGDNILTIFFDVPRGARIGFKYTWGLRGAVWTGSEEWPGNSRIIEAVDVNGDDIIYRRDVFGDEASNKDHSNASIYGTGSISWTTNLRGYGIETQEQKVDTNNDCIPDSWITPTSVGALTIACTQ